MTFRNLLSIIICGCILGIVSCTDVLLGENPENTSENNFELFWNDLDQHYGLFHIRGWNWDSIRTEYTPLFKATNSIEQQWQYYTTILDYLDDSHTVMHRYDTDSTFRSGSTLNNQAILEFDLDLIDSLYLDPLEVANPEEQILYTTFTDKNIGYINIKSFLGYDETTIDIAIDALRDEEAIIVDIRNSRGGNDITAQRLAGVFADGEHFVYTSQSRNGKEHDDFDEPLEQFTAKMGARQYEKPVILLTDRKTISAAEEFGLHMKAFDHVVQIGDNTAGDFSDVSTVHFLPNGWIYVYSYQMYLLPDGTSLDGIGCIPDIYVKNTKEDIEARQDKVIERTLEFLKDEYGIM